MFKELGIKSSHIKSLVYSSFTPEHHCTVQDIISHGIIIMNIIIIQYILLLRDKNLVKTVLTV